MVSFVGWKELELSAPEDSHARTVVDRGMKRLQSLTEGVMDARIHIKGATKYGRLSRYEGTIYVTCSDGPIHAQASGWDVKAVLHTLFDSAENQMKHRLVHEEPFYSVP